MEDTLVILKQVGRVARIVLDWTWKAEDPSCPPHDYELHRPIDPCLFGHCSPYLARNAPQILSLAETQLHPSALRRARAASSAAASADDDEDGAWA